MGTLCLMGRIGPGLRALATGPAEASGSMQGRGTGSPTAGRRSHGVGMMRDNVGSEVVEWWRSIS